eukprot:CAMPEP_0174890420 /NCGR_PEP_ID=MMETSP0167-20121228/5575_1 /TAXON_ID=38298 /ORGANISM="Rhodella maculata, Strain CCMP736" /LENGTH=92 /DNA_ID=CAMNT_0016128219 /DNA_START=889 /DNA_END=1164 /DNA_ORIENTATION=+
MLRFTVDQEHSGCRAYENNDEEQKKLVMKLAMLCKAAESMSDAEQRRFFEKELTILPNIYTVARFQAATWSASHDDAVDPESVELNSGSESE